MWENFVFLVMFATCDVMYTWSISLLSPIVPDNIFGHWYFEIKLIDPLSTMERKMTILIKILQWYRKWFGKEKAPIHLLIF